MPMRDALTTLHTLYPVQGWVYVGAGNGHFLDQAVSHPAQALLAIEADDALYAQLAAKIEQHPHGRALHLLVGGKDEANSFYRHSNPKENGLLSAELLTPLWKNLRLREAIATPAQTLNTILASAGQGPSYNWLTLACLPALPLLQGLGRTLQQFDVIQARVVLLDDAALTAAGASRPAVDAWLQAQGFKPLLVQEETNAQLANVLYARDWKTQAAKTNKALTLAHQTKIDALSQEKTELIAVRDGLSQEKAALTQAHEQQSKLAVERQAQIDALSKEKAELIAVRDGLSQEKAALTQAHEQQNKLLADRQAKIDALSKERADIITVCDSLSKKRAALIQTHQEQSDLSAIYKSQLEEKLQQAKLQHEKLAKELSHTQDKLHIIQELKNTELLENFFSQQKKQFDVEFKNQSDERIRVRKYLDSLVKQEVSNATKQIQAFVGLQTYFVTGDLPNVNTERHSWPVSADFSLYLVELLEFNDYDIIIEFGSGISTVIIAKALTKMAGRRQGKRCVEFLSFDHLERYHDQTLAQLKKASLAGAVQLHLTPLQDYTAPDGKIYSYYACQAILAAVAQRHPAAGLRVLVIVDGPPGATGPQARYPAGPLICSYFKGAQIDLLLNDYIRADEKEIAKRWQQELQATQQPFSVRERQLEKDACLIAVGNIQESS